MPPMFSSSFILEEISTLNILATDKYKDNNGKTYTNHTKNYYKSQLHIPKTLTDEKQKQRKTHVFDVPHPLVQGLYVCLYFQLTNDHCVMIQE